MTLANTGYSTKLGHSICPCIHISLEFLEQLSKWQVSTVLSQSWGFAMSSLPWMSVTSINGKPTIFQIFHSSFSPGWTPTIHLFPTVSSVSCYSCRYHRDQYNTDSLLFLIWLDARASLYIVWIVLYIAVVSSRQLYSWIPFLWAFTMGSPKDVTFSVYCKQFP